MLHLFYHSGGFIVYNSKKELIYQSDLKLQSSDDYDELRDYIEYRVMKDLDRDSKDLIILLILLGNLAIARELGSRTEIRRVDHHMRRVAHVTYIHDVDDAPGMMVYYSDNISSMWSDH